MGAQAAINTSDMITSAKNKLNNLPGGSQQQTQSTMDKTFAASQRSRGDYGTMLTNVSKTMTLASDAFQGNVDNAIKFQEIMSKAYTVGGASAAEQSSSMYQLVQALGSGVLQGDELRSVREGAAYAYKEIERFAQGIYGAEENLKDLASEGKITSDLVVAAILSAEEKINQAFENTDMTFAQAGTNIKNTAIKAFEPVLTMLNDALNSSAGKAIISGIGNAIIIVANAVHWLFSLIQRVYQFVSDNWSVISKIIMSIGAAIAIFLLPKLIAKIKFLMWAIYYYGVLAGAAVASAIKTAAVWAITNWQLALVLIILAAVVVAIIWVADSFVDACGIIVGSVFWVGAVIYNIIATIINIATGLLTAMTLIAGNIAIAFYNAWQSAKASFWEWVSECLNGTGLIARAVSKIAELFGLDSVSIDTKINDAKSKMKDYYSWDEINSGFDALSMKDASEAYQNGYGVGSEFGQGIVDKLDGLKNKLGLDSLPNAFDPSYNVGGIGNGYDPAEALKGIKGDTGDIADSMELTKEDLEYLRRVADMEWKKEYTTASITVDMTNNNQINGDGDLDGIVTRLADKLYEEMNVVANGVYAY
jgi:tape measure domain-containing protein